MKKHSLLARRMSLFMEGLVDCFEQYLTTRFGVNTRNSNGNFSSRPDSSMQVGRKMPDHPQAKVEDHAVNST